jgi:hypothetical protein
MVIKRFRPISCAKILGVIYAIFGLLAGIAFSLVSMSGAFGSAGPRVPGGALFGTFAIVFLPIAYGVIGFIAALIGCWLYNILAGIVGGMEVDIE